ncbi:Hypp1712 [Branchiostoma lanceolatum]|uniref:Hypp1712 protein n=1 Tax=Branchiostoma lanceolatum TaxID=7740 RepID=A0A8J9ZJT2_BRALA|nr:Hypp1712 [Branchiostoma lanceolatum]
MVFHPYRCREDSINMWEKWTLVIYAMATLGVGTYAASLPEALQPVWYAMPEAILPGPQDPNNTLPEELASNTLTLRQLPGGILPKLQQLLTDAVEGSYTVSSDCSVNLGLSGCRLDITSDPDFCLTVRPLLSTVLPNLSLDDYKSGVASDLLDVAVSSSYVDRCDKKLSVSGGTTQPITIVPSVVTLNEFSVDVTYTFPSSFNALLSGVWSIGDVDFTVTIEKFDDGFTLSGTVAETTGVTTDRLISGLSSFVPGNDISELFHLLKLDSISVTDINVMVMILDGGYSLELDFKTNILDSQVFLFLSSADADDGSTSYSFSMGMSVKSVRLGDLIRDVVDDNVVVPIISDLVIPEAALLGTTTTPELDYPVPLLNEVASELSSGLGIAFTMKLSEDVPFGTFFLGFDGNRYMFKVLSDETVPVSALLSKVISSFTSISLPAQIPEADVLAGSLKSFEYDTDTNVMSISAEVDDSLVIIENILVLEDLTASFQLGKASPSSGKDYNFGFELESVWSIGQLIVPLSVSRDPTTGDFSASGSVEDELPVGALIQEFGASFLPPGPLRDILFAIGLDDFSIVDPSVAIVFGQEFAVHLGGSAVIGDWSSTVEMIVGRVQSKLVMAAGVTLSNIGIVPAVRKLTGIDLSVIPGAGILSHTSVAFAVSPSTMPRDQHLTMSSPLLADVNIRKGVSIAASFTLPPDCGQDVFCKVVKKLLGADIELKLLATLTTVSDLYMKAVIGTPLTLADGIVMQDVGFEIEVGTTNNAIGITGSLELETPPVILRGGIGVSQSGGYLKMSSEGMWNEAFGLDFLAIGDINFELSITPEPSVIASLEFGGRAIIGFQNNPSATPIEGFAYFGVNKIDPRQNYCSGSITALTARAILRAFGQSFQLPSFLEEIGFPDKTSFSFSALEQTLPNGVAVPQGFFFKAKIQILFFSVSADIKLDSTSLYAEVTVTPFNIGNGLIQISGSGSETGPILKVDISWIPIHAELLIDGSVTVLGITASTTVSMDASRTYFAIEGKFLNKFSASLEIEAPYGSLKEAEFSATGTFKNDLLSTLQNKVEGFLDNLVKEANNAVTGAQDKVKRAHDACDDAKRPFNSAKANVDSAQRDFDNAVASLEGAERNLENKKRKFDDASRSLKNKEAGCKRRKCKWWDAPCHATNAALAICRAALKIARGVVEAAKSTLDVAKFAVSGAQEIVDNSRWTLDAAKGVLEGTKATVHGACDVGIDAVELMLTVVKETHKFGLNVAKKAINGVLGGVLDIREMGFSVTVAVAQTGSFEGWMEASFFKADPVTLDIAIDIFSIEDMKDAILDVIKDIVDK